MNNEEAKFILSAYRPGGQDADDDFFQSALERTAADPALRDWFSDQQIFDQKIASALRQVQVPPALKDQILAGGNLPQPASRPWYQSWSAGLAAAAAILLLFGLGFLNRPEPVPLTRTSLIEHTAQTLEEGVSLGLRANDLTEINAWLADRGTPGPSLLPGRLADLQALGCQVLKLAGHPVSLICLQHNGEVIHLLVMDHRILAEPAGAEEAGVPLVTQGDQWSMAQWSDEHHTYLLAGRMPRERLERFL